MGLFKRLAGRPSTSAEAEEPPIEMPRKKSSFVVPSSEPVTEASLKVFRGLPVAIRHDPSMVSFQQEHERWKGKRKFNLVSVSRRHRRCFSQHPKPDFIFYRFSIAFINLHPVGRQIPPSFITRFLRAPFFIALRDGISAEHDEAASHHSGIGFERFAKTASVDEVENDSDSDGGEFITIKVTNEEGKTEAEEVDHIDKHKAK